MVVEHLKILNKQNMLCTTLLRNELRTLEKEMVHAFKAFAKPKKTSLRYQIIVKKLASAGIRKYTLLQ